MKKKKSITALDDVTGIKPYWSYLEHLKIRKQSESTVRIASMQLKHLALFLKEEKKELHDLSTDDLYRFREVLEARGLGPSTVDHTLRRLRTFFNWLTETGEIFMNPYAGLKLGRAPVSRPRVPTEAEMKRLLAQPDVTNKIGLRDRAILEMLYSTAIRRSELINLSITDVDLDRGTVRVFGKGSKERLVPLGRKAANWLRDYIRSARPKLTKGNLDCDRLWLSYRQGHVLDGPALGLMLGTYSKCAGLKRISPHAIRRACATHMLRNGAHPVQIQLLLGHASVNMLSRYLQLNMTDIKETHARSKPGK